MSNRTVPAAAEGIPSISRRTLLRSAAGAATLGGIAIMATPSTATTPIPVNGDLARLIEAHQEAHDALDAFLPIVSEAERASHQDRASETLRDAKDKAHDRQHDLLDAEKAAFLALLSYPVATLDELRMIIGIGKKTWWDHDTLSDEEGVALVSGIMGVAR